MSFILVCDHVLRDENRACRDDCIYPSYFCMHSQMCMSCFCDMAVLKWRTSSSYKAHVIKVKVVLVKLNTVVDCIFHIAGIFKE